MINCTKGNVVLDGSGEQIFAELVIVLVSVYETIKDTAGADEEFASVFINSAYNIAMKKIDKKRDM